MLAQKAQSAGENERAVCVKRKKPSSEAVARAWVKRLWLWRWLPSWVTAL